MAAIFINDLQAGFDLISDQDSYLNELHDDESLLVQGGTPTTPVCTVIATVVAFSASAAATAASAALVTVIVDYFN
jgi:urocanate hydratase